MARVADFINRQIDSPPTTEVGIGGFKLIARVRESYEQKAQIPTTYLENGEPVNDHIIRDPLILTIEGSVANVYIEPSTAIQRVTRIQAEIGNISQYAPSRTQSQISRINGIINDIADQIRVIDSAIDAGEQALDFFGNRDRITKRNQELFIDAMDALYYGSQLFSIDMPYRRYDNMVITSFVNEKNNQLDEFKFKLQAQQFRFSELEIVQISAKSPSPGVNGQLDGSKDKGSQSGEEVEESFATSIINRFKK